MPTPVLPLKTFMIGTGDNAVAMGLYAIVVKDDTPEHNIIQRGFTFCPVGLAENEMHGLYDPEQSTRIGFSEERDTAIAVAGGSEQPHDLTDAQLETARDFIKNTPASLSMLVRSYSGDKEIVIDNMPPTNLTPNEYDRQQSPSIFLSYDSSGNQDVDLGLAQELIAKFASLTTDYNYDIANKQAAPESPETMESTLSGYQEPEQPSAGWASKVTANNPDAMRLIGELTMSLRNHHPDDKQAVSSVKLVDAMAPHFQQRQPSAELLATLFAELRKSFSGDRNAAANGKILQDMHSALNTNPDLPSQ